MKLFLLTCSLQIFFSTSLLSQSDTINQLDSENQKQGYWEKRYPNGNLVYAGYFKNDVPVGIMNRYYENGNMQAQMNYSQDGIYSETKLYYEDGKLSATGFYYKTLKDSIWKYYSYYTGTLVSEERYVKGKKNGIQKSFYPTGSTAEEIEYKDNYKEGTWKQYFEDGNIKMVSKYNLDMVNGRYTFYYPDGVVYIVGTFVENKRNGPWVFYDEKGKEKYRLIYSNGILSDEDQKRLREEDQEFFKMIDESVGKYEDPTIEDIFR